jgi:hypothetical protein
LAERAVFVAVDNLDPFLQTLPLPEQDEKVILAYFVEGLDFLEPLFDWDELCGFAVDELAHSLAAESVVIMNIFLYYLRVGHHFHVVVVVLVDLNHVDELVCC